MTTDFALTVTLADLRRTSPPPRWDTRGVCLGSAPDGTATVFVLGACGQESVAAELAAEYVRAGRDPVCCATGDVGAVVLDHANRTATAVTPPIGLRQVFWEASGSAFSIGSSPQALAVPGQPSRSIVPSALFSYIYFHMLPGPGGAHQGITKLDSGHCLRWHGDGIRLTRHWHAAFDDTATMSQAEAARELHLVLREAVRRRIESRRSPGAFLSGGLDSSTVAGLAAQIRPGIPTVSMGFDAAGYDEMEYARIASRHFGTRPLEYYVTPNDVLATLPKIAAAFAEPFGNSSAAAAYHCARIAREQGLDLLLAGDGGDEIFGGNERYARQLVFERYARLPTGLRRGVLEPLVAAAARMTTKFPVGKARSYIEQANLPLPDRLQSYNFLHRHDPAEIFEPELLSQVDVAAPLQTLRDEYAEPAATSAVNRMLFLDWKFTLHDNDLVKVNTMCDLAGVDVAYPMLDQSVVDFSLRLPADWKVRGGDLRWFYKRAMRDFLPREIIRKSKHGFGLPFGVWTRTHAGLRGFSEDALQSLGRRGYFRKEFLQEALRLHREGHASYYGELVWILMVLELWLQAHMPKAGL